MLQLTKVQMNAGSVVGRISDKERIREKNGNSSILMADVSNFFISSDLEKLISYCFYVLHDNNTFGKTFCSRKKNIFFDLQKGTRFVSVHSIQSDL